MAANASKFQTTIQLVYADGKNANGKDKTKTIKFSKVDTAASDDSIYAVATALAGLMTVTITDIEKLDSSKILNQ